MQFKGRLQVLSSQTHLFGTYTTLFGLLSRLKRSIWAKKRDNVNAKLPLEWGK